VKETKWSRNVCQLSQPFGLRTLPFSIVNLIRIEYPSEGTQDTDTAKCELSFKHSAIWRLSLWHTDASGY